MVLSDPFNGTWTIDLAESKVWDHAQGRHVPDEVGEEVITLRIENGVQEYEVLYGDSPKFRMGYTAQYDAKEWADYAVREIISTSGDPKAETEAFKQRIKADSGEASRQLELGKTYALVRLVYIDEQTHYRIGRNPLTGGAPSVLSRRLAEDGQFYLTHLMDNTGTVFRIRKFVRA